MERGFTTQLARGSVCAPLQLHRWQQAIAINSLRARSHCAALRRAASLLPADPAWHNAHVSSATFAQRVRQARPHPAADSRSGSLQEASRAPQHLRARLRGAPGNVFLGPLCLPRPPLLRLPQALPRPLASQRQPALRSLAAFLVEQEGGKGGERGWGEGGGGQRRGREGGEGTGFTEVTRISEEDGGERSGDERRTSDEGLGEERRYG